jgi:hypothetical protein
MIKKTKDQKMKTLNRFYLSTSDDRRKKNYSDLQKKISKVLNMEPGKAKDSNILVISSFTGEMLTKKLYEMILKFQKKEMKCYIYSRHSDSLREIISIEKGDFPDSGIYAVVIHAGMQIHRYRAYQNIIEHQ